MFHKHPLIAFTAALSAAMLLSACSEEPAEETTVVNSTTEAVESTLSQAITAMGMADLDSITYSGTAWRIRNSFMQTPSASPPWPSRDTITNYRRTIDLSNLAMPVSVASGETFAQNLFFDPAVAGTYTQNIGADQSEWRQQMEIWLTPWGFLKGAEANNPTEVTQVLDGETVTIVTWESPEDQTSPSGMQYTVNGYINEDNLVARVETWVEDPFLGDMNVVALYSDYMDFDGLMVPLTMEQQRGGGSIFGVDVEEAVKNPPNVAELTAIPAQTTGGPGGGGGGAPAAAEAQMLAEGVYLITGVYNALAVEFTDYVAVFEAGESEARGEQILELVNATFPGKEVRYVINSHPHSDHTAGLVPFVREGATIITHENNVPFLMMALSNPRTLLGEDTLSPEFEAAGDVMVLEDASMRLEMHHIPNDHSDGMLVAYLPEQGILFQADFTLPQPGAEPNPFVVNLAEYVDQNNLQFEQYLAVHAAQMPQTRADLMATIGK